MRKEGKDTVLVAMSGGVDSSVTALLLKQAGCSVKGAILRLHDADMTPEDLVNGKLPQNIWYAREAARRIRLDFSIFDVRESFRKTVEQSFLSAYQQGLTPNPCVPCNTYLIFPEIVKAAEQLECDKVALGHYARVEYSEERGRYIIRKGLDHSKDQSFMLYRLSQEQLSKLLTPLGSYRKDEIRKLAEDARLKNARVPDSKDTCFIPERDVILYLETQLRQKALEAGQDPEQIPGLIPGDFVDAEGHVLGTHRGLIYYQIGQQVDVQADGATLLFVSGKHADTNQVVLGPKEDLLQETLRAGRVHLSGVSRFSEEPVRVSVKIGPLQTERDGWASMLSDGTLEIKLEDPIYAPAAGQDLVLYDGDIVLAGGVIL